MIHHKKLRICFVAHNAYGALTGRDAGHIGGIERQQSLMSKWLAKRGHQVSVITWEEGQEDELVVEGVRILRMCGCDAGIKGLRFFHPKWTSLGKAMKSANADIYYYNCGDLGLGQVVMWCRRHGRKSVYSVANDPDCDPKLPVLRPLRERFLYRYGLKRVDSIVVQTRRQQHMLREGFGIESVVLPMPCEGPNQNVDDHSDAEPEEVTHILWVGRISEQKRLEWLLDIAEKCPELVFNVVGAANTGSEYAETLTKRASGILNVKMHGRTMHAAMAKYYQSCRILCCTSAYEGFPNTFLEAWSLGIPIVSTFDPDDVIKTNELGFVAHDKEEIVSRLLEITQSPEIWLEASKASKRYFLTYHATDVSLPRFEQFLLSMTQY